MKRYLLPILLTTALLALPGVTLHGSAAQTANGQPEIQAAPAAQPRFTVTDLGTLGGASEAFAISENGKVAGMYTPGSYEQAFLWEDGVMQGLGTLGGSRSQARGVNDAGQVVGYSQTSSGYNHAFLWENGAMQDLGTFPGGIVSMANAINNSGQVAGHSSYGASGGYELHAFRWSGGMTDLGTLGGDASWGYGINESGHVVGQSMIAPYPDNTGHAFLWSGGMQDLGTGGWIHSRAMGMNDNGDVVGLLGNDDGTNTYHAFLWSGGIQDLGGPQKMALDINNAGLIVGESGQGGLQAILWENGQMKDLNTLIDAGSGWVLQSARAINEKGQIVGKGSFNGATRAFMLTPNAYHWINPNGGVWHLATNWDPQGIPGGGDSVVFDLNGQYTVDVSALASGNPDASPEAFSIDRMVLASTNFVYLNNMDLNMVYDQPEDPSLQVNDGATAAVNSGTATFSHAVIGGAPPANPSNPPLARLQVLGNGVSLTGSGRLTIGEEGMGELFVTAGGQLASAESRLGGLLPGVADVGGNGSEWNTGNIAVGHEVSGTLEIKLGGRVNSDSGFVAFGASSDGSRVDIDEAAPSPGPASMWALQGDLIIGQGDEGLVGVDNGGDLFVFQDVQILRGSLWIEGTDSVNDPSDLDVLGTVFVGGPASPLLMLQEGGKGDIEGDLIIGQDGAGSVILWGFNYTASPTQLDVKEPQAGLCAIGRAFDGYLALDSGGLLTCQNIQVGGQAGATGTGHLNMDGGVVVALDVLQVGQGHVGGGAGRVEMQNGARVMAEGLYIAPNGVIAGTGTADVGSLGLKVEGIMSPGIIVNFPFAASHESIAQSQEVTGTLIVSGTLTMGPTGRLEIPVTGKNVGQYGSLGVTDAAALDGVLELNFSNWYAPKQGDTFTFLIATGTVSGTFDSVEISGLAPGFEYEISNIDGLVTLEALNDGVAVDLIFLPLMRR